MAGRSNAVGSAATTTLTLAEKAQYYPGICWEYLGEPWQELPGDQGWHPAGPQFRRNGGGVLDDDLFGPDLFLGRALNAALGSGRRVAILKYAHGGTPLSQWLPATGPDYPAMMQVISDALAALAEPYVLRGFLFYNCEGESNQELVNYPANQDAISDAVRADLGDPNLPVFLMGSCPDWTIADPSGLLAVQEAYVATRPNTYLISTVGLTLLDGLHFDTEGMKELGNRSAAAVLAAGIL